MEGEDTGSDDDNAFCNKPVWKRIIVVCAGAIFNLIFGFVLMMIIVGISTGVATTTVSKFDTVATSNQGGLLAGDTILEVEGRSIYTADDIVYILGTVQDGKVQMEVERDGEIVELNNVQFPVMEEDGHKFTVLDFYFTPMEKNVGTVISQGFKKTVSMGRLVWMSLGDLVSGKYGLSEVSGPVGVTQIMSDAAQSVATNGIDGLLYLLRIIAMITVNLGIFNLLPIPALDGGRLIFLIIEGIRRKPIPPEKEGIVHMIGMVLLFGFMILIVFKDLWTWIF